MTIDLMTVLYAVLVAVLCLVFSGAGLGVVVVAWGAYVAWGLPVAAVVTTFYLGHGWPAARWWPWRQTP